MPGPDLVPRDLQSSWGLFTGVMLYSVAIGGIFSLLNAYAGGRVGRFGPRATAVLLAAAAFVAIYLVPFLKYPANPPSVGNPDTIQYRTALYFGMIVISVAAMVACVNLVAGRCSAGSSAGTRYWPPAPPTSIIVLVAYAVCCLDQ